MTQLSFIAADVIDRRRPSEPIARSASIEPPYRYWLARAWGAGPTIGWIGLNPSIADATRDDPTMLREMGFSFRWGFGALVKVNLEPFIASSQKDLRTWRNALEHDKSAVIAALTNHAIAAERLAECSLVMAAWGNGADPATRDRFITAVQDRLKRRLNFMCLGMTDGGAPIHPMARGQHRVPDDRLPTAWRL